MARPGEGHHIPKIRTQHLALGDIRGGGSPGCCQCRVGPLLVRVHAGCPAARAGLSADGCASPRVFR